MLIKEFNKAFSINLIDIMLSKIEKLKNIEEYDFYLIYIRGILEDQTKQDLFIKVIKKGKIKETVFCICKLIYEQYFIKCDDEKDKLKITIDEKSINKISINLFNNNLDKTINIQVNFIKIQNIINKKFIMKGWNNFEINQEDILALGMKNNT